MKFQCKHKTNLPGAFPLPSPRCLMRPLREAKALTLWVGFGGMGSSP